MKYNRIVNWYDGWILTVTSDIMITPVNLNNSRFETLHIPGKTGIKKPAIALTLSANSQAITNLTSSIKEFISIFSAFMLSGK